MAWHKAAGRSRLDFLEKLWDCAKELQLNPKELRNELLLSRVKSQEMGCHKATQRGQVEILEKLWGYAKILQINPD